VALIDWEWAGPVDPRIELAEVCWANAGLHDDIVAEREGLPSLRSALSSCARSLTDMALRVPSARGSCHSSSNSRSTRRRSRPTWLEFDPTRRPRISIGECRGRWLGELALLRGSSIIARCLNKRWAEIVPRRLPQPAVSGLLPIDSMLLHGQQRAQHYRQSRRSVFRLRSQRSATSETNSESSATAATGMID
jgi:hypothetical protein